MTRLTGKRSGEIVRADLDCGIKFAATFCRGATRRALVFRVLVGVADEPLELTGINGLVERTLSKGTKRFTGRSLADAFDALGASWASLSGRQSTIVRVLCLPEFVVEAVGLVAEMLCRPTFPDEACEVAVELARQELRQMEDEPDELINVLINRLTLAVRAVILGASHIRCRVSRRRRCVSTAASTITAGGYKWRRLVRLNAGKSGASRGRGLPRSCQPRREGVSRRVSIPAGARAPA